MATVLSIVFVLGTLLAQFFYPLLSKKFKKMQLITVTSIVIIIAYLLFYLLGFPVFSDMPIAHNDPALTASGSMIDGILFAFGGTHWIIFLLAFLFFAATGIFYLALLVMFQDAIDYQEWKFGERKEAIAFAWRPLDAKIGSALQTGMRNITFLASGTYLIINNISTAESHNVIENGTSVYKGTYESFEAEIEAAYQWSDKQQQLAIFGAVVIGIIIVAFLACFLLLKFGYHIDEDLENQIVKELKERHEKDENKIEIEAKIPEVKMPNDLISK